MPTPASAAIRRTGASTPSVMNTDAAASSSAFSFRRASARLPELPVVDNGSSPPTRRSSP
jgi:hypothetical protein